MSMKKPTGPNGPSGLISNNCLYKPSSVPLRAATIYLRCRLPGTSSDQPGRKAGHFSSPLFGLAPDGVFQASRFLDCWCALTAPFQHCHETLRPFGVFFSAALSVGSPPLDVIQHPALWSSDFPQIIRPAVTRDSYPSTRS